MKVIIPTALRKHTDGNQHVSVAAESAGTVKEALRQVTDVHPDLRDKLFDGSGKLVSFVNVFVNEQNIRDLDDEATKLNDSDEILLVPAIAGG